MAVDEGWKKLGRRVQAERSRRWKTRPEFAEACGLSARVIAALELGERANYRQSTIDRVEATLGWEHGSADLVRRGRRPVRVEDEYLIELRALWPGLSSDARRMLVELARRARG